MVSLLYVSHGEQTTPLTPCSPQPQPPDAQRELVESSARASRIAPAQRHDVVMQRARPLSKRKSTALVGDRHGGQRTTKMQLIHQEFERKGDGGALTLVAESSEDLWHVYNLVMKGDLVKATTIRKVTKETSMGSQESQRMRLTLEVAVEDVEYDPAGGQMRIRGKVLYLFPCCDHAPVLLLYLCHCLMER